jgi:hypothetical protein
MSKVAPRWFWIVYGLISMVAIIAFVSINMSVGAFFTPILELPPIYWLALAMIVIPLAILLGVLSTFIQRSRIPPSRTGFLAAVIGNAIVSAMFFGVLLITILLQTNSGGMIAFLAVMGTFNLSMVGILSARLDRLRKGT